MIGHHTKDLKIDFILKFIVSNSKNKVFIICIFFEDFSFRYCPIKDMIGSIAVYFRKWHMLNIHSSFKI